VPSITFSGLGNPGLASPIGTAGHSTGTEAAKIQHMAKDPGAAFVNELYGTRLGRWAEEPALKSWGASLAWTNALVTGATTQKQAIHTFVSSPEFLNRPATLDNYAAAGLVSFFNIQAGLQQGGIAPYFGIGQSDLIGPNIQFGSILNLTGLTPVNATTFTFSGEVGPNPLLPGHPNIHVIATAGGRIYCTWTAVFTLQFNADGNVIFSGDGDFTVIGGTGRYRNASGQFRTLFQTDPVPPSADTATANWTQSGSMNVS
jgi:hypothetical protein